MYIINKSMHYVTKNTLNKLKIFKNPHKSPLSYKSFLKIMVQKRKFLNLAFNLLLIYTLLFPHCITKAIPEKPSPSLSTSTSFHKFLLGFQNSLKLEFPHLSSPSPSPSSNSKSKPPSTKQECEASISEFTASLALISTNLSSLQSKQAINAYVASKAAFSLAVQTCLNKSLSQIAQNIDRYLCRFGGVLTYFMEIAGNVEASYEDVLRSVLRVLMEVSEGEWVSVGDRVGVLVRRVFYVKARGQCERAQEPSSVCQESGIIRKVGVVLWNVLKYSEILPIAKMDQKCLIQLSAFLDVASENIMRLWKLEKFTESIEELTDLFIELPHLLKTKCLASLFLFYPTITDLKKNVNYFGVYTDALPNRVHSLIQLLKTDPLSGLSECWDWFKRVWKYYEVRKKADKFYMRSGVAISSFMNGLFSCGVGDYRKCGAYFGLSIYNLFSKQAKDTWLIGDDY